jgi:hypothetical protein
MEQKLALKIFFLFFIMGLNALANAPKVGKKAAAKYFQAQSGSAEGQDQPSFQPRHPSSVEPLSTEDRYLALGLSQYLSTDSYNWGSSTKEEGVGKWGLDMTYRISQSSNLLDQAVRISYTEFEPAGKRATKMSFMYALTLPDAGSQFPLYFGFAVGPGIFFKQLPDESPLALDYQMFAGLRLFNVFEKTGFYVEGGLKNHLQLTSDGQVNGTYFSAGAIFTF